MNQITFEIALKQYELEPYRIENLYQLAQAVSEEFGPSEALSFYQELVTREDQPIYEEELGICYLKMEHYQEALLHLQQVVKRIYSPRAWLQIGYCHLMLTQYHQAITAYQNVVNTQYRKGLAHYNLGLCYEEIKDFSKAKHHYQLALINADEDLPNLSVQIYFAYGTLLFQNKQFQEAQEQLLKTLELDPQHIDALFNLGLIHISLSNHEQAEQAFKQVIDLNPEHVSAQHLLSSMQGVTSAAPPKGYVESLFDQYANHFDQSLLKSLDYQLYNVLEVLQSHLNPKLLPAHRLLDLGCGTGLLERFAPQLAQQFIGVDLSKKMLEVAQDKANYLKLIHGDIIEVTANLVEQFELIMSLDTLNYLGDHTAIYRAVRNRLSSQGYFAFTIEHQDLDEESSLHKNLVRNLVRDGYALSISGRYVHTSQYIENTLKSSGFKVTFSDILNGRKERSKWVKVKLYLCQIDESVIY